MGDQDDFGDPKRCFVGDDFAWKKKRAMKFSSFCRSLSVSIIPINYCDLE